MLNQIFPGRPRILHAYKTYRPETEGGIPTAIAALCAACPDADSTILTCGTPGAADVDGAWVVRARAFGQLFSLPLAPSWPLHFWSEAADADLVVVHTPFPLADAAAALHFPDRAGLVVHWHSDIVSQRRLGALISPVTQLLLDRADAIVISNPALAESAALTRHRKKLVTIPFGIDTGSWSAPLDDEQAARRSMLRACFPRLIAAVGRLVPYKGFSVLIEAMRRIDAQLVIIGEGPQRRNLEHQILEAGLSGRVILSGRVDSAELQTMLHSADVFAFPSILPSETFGIAQLEAMACGLPVVNTALPTGVPWVARHEREALTVPPGDPDALALALQRLLQEPALARQLGAAGKIRANVLFSHEQFTQRVQNLYGGILQERGRSVPYMAMPSVLPGT
jgi:glycosyltransferase involved in cell wall biosynthesis